MFAELPGVEAGQKQGGKSQEKHHGDWQKEKEARRDKLDVESMTHAGIWHEW